MIAPIIWVRQPKTGGTSIKWFLLYGTKKVPSYIEQNPDPFNGEKEGLYLTTYPNYTKIVMIETNHEENAVRKFRNKYPEFFEEAIKFTIVRNPWDKFVSGWKHCHTTKDKPFEEVVKSPPTKKENIHDWNHLTRTQVHSIRDEDGKLLVDKILYFEDLEQQFRSFLEEINMSDVYQGLPKLRTNKHKDYRNYYTTETKETIKKKRF